MPYDPTTFHAYVRKSQLAITMYTTLHNWILNSPLSDLDKGIELASLDHVHCFYELPDKLRKFEAIARRLGVKFTDTQ